MIKTIGELLKGEKSKVSTAESCTAGYISNLLTSIPGSSDYFEGSLVVYSNEAKINVLGVDKELIDKHTEVSFNVALEMANRVKKVMNTNYSVATTGYADTKGYGTDYNPAGTIYVAVSYPGGSSCEKFTFKHSRARNIYLVTIEAMRMLSEAIRSHQVESL